MTVERKRKVKESNIDQGYPARLYDIRKALKLSQRDFASRLNISAPGYAEIENGKYKPNYELIFHIAREYNVNLYYLIYGIGPMFLNFLELPFESFGSGYSNAEELKELLWYFKHSEIARYHILSDFRKLIIGDGLIIEKELNDRSVKKPPSKKPG